MIALYKWKTIETHVKVNVEKEEFINLIKTHKPNALFDSMWSDKHPFILINNLQGDVVTYHYSSRIYENPKVYVESLEKFYIRLTNGGCSLNNMSLTTIE